MEETEKEKEDSMRKMVALPIACSLQRAGQVYGEAFLRGFEYIVGTGGLKGDILEFGTFRGYTAHVIANIMQTFRYPGHLWLYDSFEGLPASDISPDKESYVRKENGGWSAGDMALPSGFEHYISESLLGIIPQISFTIVKGFFEDVMDERLTQGKAVIVHLDCDLYSSTRYVLDKLIEKDVLQDGMLLYCDDYNCNRANPYMGQRRALSEVFHEKSRFYCSDFYAYGWGSKAFFVHDREASV